METKPVPMAAPRPPLWRRPQLRDWLLQALLLLAVLGGIAYLFDNALGNLARQGIAFGFGCWNERAGFGIGVHLIEYSEASSYGRAFWVGLLNTLLVAGLGIVFATLVGFIVGVERLSPHWLIRKW